MLKYSNNISGIILCVLDLDKNQLSKVSWRLDVLLRKIIKPLFLKLITA